jgi:hypothetical protein
MLFMHVSCHGVYIVSNAAAWTNAGIVWTRGMDKLQVRPDQEKWSINGKKKQFIGADKSQVYVNNQTTRQNWVNFYMLYEPISKTEVIEQKVTMTSWWHIKSYLNEIIITKWEAWKGICINILLLYYWKRLVH